MLEKVNPSTISDKVIRQIIRLIKEGRMKPGDKLPNEIDLMEMHNVGRSTIREAKKVLISKQVLESSPGRGTYIKELGFNSVLDSDILEVLLQDHDGLASLTESREILETETSVLASKRAGESDLISIEAALKRMKECTTPKELYDYGILFHMSIAKASHNQVLIKVYHIILDIYRQIQPQVYEDNIPEVIRIHTSIFEAIKDRDPVRTRQVMKDHFDYVRMVSKRNDEV